MLENIFLTINFGHTEERTEMTWTSSRLGFALQNRPHLHRAYLVTVRYNHTQSVNCLCL